MSLRHATIDLGFRAFAATGMHRRVARYTQGVGAILTFHRVGPSPGGFDPQAALRIAPSFLDTLLETLSQGGIEVVTLDEALFRLGEAKQGREVARFVALTFDDGYRDTLTHALPLLKRWNAPFTLYATCGFADGAARMWWIELEEAIRRLDHVALEIGGASVDRKSASDAEKRAAFRDVYARLRKVDEPQLLAAVDALASSAGLDPAAICAATCMNWAELASIAAEPLCAIGSHTLTHPRLARVPEDLARREISESRAHLAARLGRTPVHICYPVGDPGSAGPREFGMAREAGYASGVTTRPGMLFPDHADALHALPRISVNGLWQSREALEIMLSGAPFALWNRFRRLNAD